MNIKDNKGITLVVLVITIIVLLIIAGITINAGTQSIKRAKLETLRTNMLLIKSKAKEICEEANFKAGVNSTDIDKGKNYIKDSEQGGKGLSTQAEDSELTSVGASLGEDAQNKYAAKLTKENLKSLGLNEVANTQDSGDFIIVFDIKNNTVEVYNTKGFKHNNETKYSLTDIEAIED